MKTVKDLKLLIKKINKLKIFEKRLSLRKNPHYGQQDCRVEGGIDKEPYIVGGMKGDVEFLYRNLEKHLRRLK